MNLKKEKQVLMSAANQACRVIMLNLDNKEVKIKSNKTLVSSADIEANNSIIKTIKKSFPHHSILSEESGFEYNNSDYKWVIDPVDGTHNFIHDIPIFGTSIALEYKNKLVLGVLKFPLLGITAFAEKNRGAYLNGKRMNVSGKKELDHSFITFEYAYANRKEKVGFLERLVHQTIDVRNFGCAIYNLLLVACGKCDGCVTLSTNEWDVAAGFLMVEEAGGKITDIQGRSYSLSDHKFIISNGKIHNKLLKYV